MRASTAGNGKRLLRNRLMSAPVVAYQNDAPRARAVPSSSLVCPPEHPATGLQTFRLKSHIISHDHYEHMDALNVSLRFPSEGRVAVYTESVLVQRPCGETSAGSAAVRRGA